MSDKSSHGVFFLDLLLFVDITNHFLWSDYTIAKHRLQVGIYSLIDLRNDLISRDKYTDIIDELLIKLTKAKVKKVTVKEV